jgi:hypothetical protein
MEVTSVLASLTRWDWLRRTAAWLFVILILAMGLSACGGQTGRSIPAVAPLVASPVPDTNPDEAPVEVNDSPAATQVTTGFNISGWV